MSARKFWLVVLASVMWPHASNALQSDAAVWQKITTDKGCIAYLYDRNDAQFPGWSAYHWAGSCTAGQAINGQGILQEHGLFFEERFVNEYHGTMVQGYFQGEMTRQRFQVNENGEWNSSNRIAELAFKAPYKRGCWVDKQNEYTQKFCERGRPGLIAAKIYKKPLWKDVKGLAVASSTSATGNGLAAVASTPAKPSDGIWTKMQSNGCTLIFNHAFDGYTADYSGDFSGNKILSLAPSFACGVDGLAQGPVRIVTTWQILKGANSGAISVDTLATTAKDGFIEGAAQFSTAGAVSWAGKTHSYNFIGGCPDIEPNCNRTAGQQLRAEFLAAGGKAVEATAAAIPSASPPSAFSKTETIAFENLGTSLAELINNVGPGGFQNEQAKIETIVAQLGLSFYSGQGAAFGGDYARVQSVQNSVRAFLAGKGASADTGQLVKLVLGAVKDSLVTSKSTPIMAPVAPVAFAAPAPPPVYAPPADSDAVNEDLVKFSSYWTVRNVGTCNAVLSHRTFRLDASGNKSDFTLPDFDMPVVAFEWTGECNSNGLIEGPGHLKIYTSMGNGTKSSLSLSDRSFTAKNGIPDGIGQTGFYEYQPDFDHPGKYEYTVIKDDFTMPREIVTEYYQDGCNTKTGYKEICDPAIGAALQARYLTDKSVVKPAINQRRVYERRIEVLFETDLQSVSPPPPPAPAPSAIAIGPKLLTNVGAMMNYPLEALRNGWQGQVGVAVSVSMIGVPLDCRITTSSGYPVLDNATCDVMRRAVFTPAINGSGTPVNGTYSSRIRWVLPE